MGEGDVEEVSSLEYNILMKKVVIPNYCDSFNELGTSNFISWKNMDAALASSVNNEASCGKQSGSNACVFEVSEA